MTDNLGQVADLPARPTVCEQSARRLIDKLKSSGELRVSYLIRVLRQGEMELFDHAFATLLQFDVEPLRRALYGDSPHTLALACRAAGIDRSAFPTVLQLCRHRKPCGAAPADCDPDAIHAIFDLMPKGAALQRLRAEAA